MSDSLVWTLLITGLLIIAEIGRTELREWNARRKAMRRGRTLTTKYAMPWHRR
jgi:hypothetical protein